MYTLPMHMLGQAGLGYRYPIKAKILPPNACHRTRRSSMYVKRLYSTERGNITHFEKHHPLALSPYHPKDEEIPPRTKQKRSQVDHRPLSHVKKMVPNFLFSHKPQPANQQSCESAQISNPSRSLGRAELLQAASPRKKPDASRATARRKNGHVWYYSS